jgi:hypothetical protein
MATAITVSVALSMVISCLQPSSQTGGRLAHQADCVLERTSNARKPVRTHLRRVYEKTGTSRQAELARLMATIGLARSETLDDLAGILENWGWLYGPARHAVASLRHPLSWPSRRNPGREGHGTRQVLEGDRVTVIVAPQQKVT